MCTVIHSFSCAFETVLKEDFVLSPAFHNYVLTSFRRDHYCQSMLISGKHNDLRSYFIYPSEKLKTSNLHSTGTFFDTSSIKPWSLKWSEWLLVHFVLTLMFKCVEYHTHTVKNMGTYPFSWLIKRGRGERKASLCVCVLLSEERITPPPPISQSSVFVCLYESIDVC